MKQQRFYRTTLNYKALLEDYNGKIKSDHWNKRMKSCRVTRKGLLNIYLYDHPGVRIQITPKGFLMLHGGSCLEDFELLKDLAEIFKKSHNDGFSVWIHKVALGDKEKDDRIDDLQCLADYQLEASIRGKEWYESQIGELAEHWVEKKTARKEIREKAALMRRQLAESAALFDFEKGLHFNANGQVFALPEKSEIVPL